MNLEDLTQMALLGTERQSLTAPTDGAPVAELLRTLDYAQKEQALLSAAALTAAYERAGRLPSRDAGPVPTPCPDEQLPQAGPAARTLLWRLLEGEQPQLLSEWLVLATKANVLVSPELLPGILNAGVRDVKLRQSILGVIGERGRWLAAQNPEWSWVGGGGDDESVWQTGATPARALFLRQCRQTQPERALELLASTWKQEAPEDRAALIAELDTGLTPGDESFLETALDDKRKEVRRCSARLLARLPSSALVKRMTERALPRLALTPAESGAKPASIEVALPGECDKPMQRDGIEPKPPQGVGEKAWWLIQMLRSVPLDVWTRQWDATPDAIVSASLSSEWKKELSEAWTQAALFQQNASWAESLFLVALEQRQLENLQGLLRALPSVRRETRIAELLEGDEQKIAEIHSMLLAACGDLWSAELSHAVLRWLRRLTTKQSADWALRAQLKDIACNLHPAVLTAANQNWKTDQPEWEFWSKGMNEFLAVIQLRSDLHPAFPQLTNSLTH